MEIPERFQTAVARMCELGMRAEDIPAYVARLIESEQKKVRRSELLRKAQEAEKFELETASVYTTEAKVRVRIFTDSVPGLSGRFAPESVLVEVEPKYVDTITAEEVAAPRRSIFYHVAREYMFDDGYDLEAAADEGDELAIAVREVAESEFNRQWRRLNVRLTPEKIAQLSGRYPGCDFRTEMTRWQHRTEQEI